VSKRRRGFAVGAFWQFASCVKVLRGGPLHQRCKNKGCEAFEGVRDPALREPSPIETAILNRLAHVLRLEVRRPLEVGDGAGDLENPVIRPRR